MADDDFSADIAAVKAIDGVQTILIEVCRLTGMGFAAVARVTEHRWVACQVQDGIDFGMDSGDELEIKTTICNEIRASGEGVMIDHVSKEPLWRTHPTPVLYGFQSYLSLPIVLTDGTFFGTLCAIDPAPREISLSAVIETIRDFARQIAEQLDLRRTG